MDFLTMMKFTLKIAINVKTVICLYVIVAPYVQVAVLLIKMTNAMVVFWNLIFYNYQIKSYVMIVKIMMMTNIIIIIIILLIY